jgi:uncharacterized protein YlzI (FlbEa/FlbD family)
MDGISIYEFPPTMVKLTDKDLGVIYVNKNHIITIQTFKTHPDKTHTKITLVDGNTLYVNESPELILVVSGEMK